MKKSDTYSMNLRSMTKGSLERYRALKSNGLIEESTFNEFVDKLILKELNLLESALDAKMMMKKIKNAS